MTDQDAQLRADLAAAQARVTAMEATAADAAASSALTQAIAGSGISDWHPGAVEQVHALLKDDVRIQRDGTTIVATGPGFVPLGDHVRAKLAEPGFAHFRRGNGASAPSVAQPAGANPLASFQRQGAAQGEPRNLGEAILLQFRADQAARPAGGWDFSSKAQPGFGLRPAAR